MLDTAVKDVCFLTDEILWEAYKRSQHDGQEKSSRLMFPRDARGNIRVSEQEARFAFVAR